ncbi:hypothetical protein VTK73DRAFT_9152 [Phialemonium thermophilum]|uniref:FAD-binding domain-containing protein n=1 Tax=Phialemonium thermophilum TaxID=223376 RepID=A0ABR3XLI4_9PEZI
MADTPKLRVAIIGAGIAGLAAAIALKHHEGIDVQIYERATALAEIGASIALGPNGMRTLDRLGVYNALDDSVAFRNISRHPMIYRQVMHYKTNEVVSTDSHQGDVEYRHLTARFYRAHLQEALLEHIDSSTIRLSKTFDSVVLDEEKDELRIKFADGTTATADLLLGADGINSAVRRFFAPTSAPTWTGWVAFRSVFPISHVEHISDLPDEACHFWGPDRTLFVSKLGKGLFTVVASHNSNPDLPDAEYKGAEWDSPGDVSVLRDYYRDWSPLVRSIVDAIPHTNVYPNRAGHGLDSWVLGGGRVTVAGDAAHAHGGAFAAGGSLALDDAWAFAQSILTVFPPDSSRKPSAADLQKALRLYEKTRKSHTDRVLETVHKGNRKRTERIGRRETDEELRARMKNREDVAWIHEHDVQFTFKNALSSLFDERRS